jgi:tRNA threonylcarbamoyladenosine biosynthesis protein TsaB
MALILSLETSAKECSVALHKDGKLLDTLEINEGQAHASKLAVLIAEVFQNVNIPMKALHAVAISGGPGSYTGLRIGASTAKGICYALNIPLISVPTLDLLVFQLLQKPPLTEGLLCPMIDAKRMEVYCQIVKQNLEIIKPVESLEVGETSFSELLKGSPMFFFGDGSEKCKNVINHKNAIFVDEVMPKASLLGLVAFSFFEKQKFENLVTFTPFYFKDFIAKQAKPVF